jgi:hypothetical protein
MQALRDGRDKLFSGLSFLQLLQLLYPFFEHHFSFFSVTGSGYADS